MPCFSLGRGRLPHLGAYIGLGAGGAALLGGGIAAFVVGWSAARKVTQ